MGVSIQWIRPDVGVARFGSQHRRFGDPYDASMVVDGDGDTAIYRALVVRSGERVDREHWKDLELRLLARGFKWYEREVVRDGQVVRVRRRAL